MHLHMYSQSCLSQILGTDEIASIRQNSTYEGQKHLKRKKRDFV